MDRSSGSTSSGLLRRVSGGDPVAWREMVDRYAPLVLFWVRQAGIPAHDFDDVVQDVFLAVVKRFADYRDQSYRGWLRVLTSRKIADYYRRAGKEPPARGGSTVLDLLRNTPGPAEIGLGVDDVPSEGPGGESFDFGGSRFPQADRVAQALAEIRAGAEPRTWSVYYAVVIEGCSREDVAREFGMNLDSLYESISRTTRRLRRRLRELGVEFPE